MLSSDAQGAGIHSATGQASASGVERGRVQPRPVPAGGMAQGSVRPPSSKSLTHRYLALALIARQPLVVRRPLEAEDSRLFLALLEAVGFTVARRADHGDGPSVYLSPPAVDGGDELGSGEPSAPVELFCGNAGTVVRLVSAALATVPGRWRVDGTPRMRQRPIGPLLAALRQWGVTVEEVGSAGCPPVIVHGGRLRGGSTRIDAGESSQYLSALLLAALGAHRESRIEATALTSGPYVELTLQAAREMGGRIERSGDLYKVWPGLALPEAVEVEGDWSAACYPAAAAALTGGRVRLRGLRVDSAQGDRKFLDLLSAMGAHWYEESGEIVVAGGDVLHSVDADLSSMPDQVPTLAALAPFARGTTRIRGVPHLRIKESDRLRAMAVELQRAGAEAIEHADGLEIAGVWADEEPPTSPLITESWDDHRIAMSMALIGLRRPGLSVGEWGVVAKSYPSFWRDLDRLTIAD